MTIHHIHAFLVHPGKVAETQQITGTAVPLKGGMFNLLDGIYSKSDQECDVDITFSNNDTGAQQNDCRDLIVAYLTKPDLVKARSIAERLATNSDGRSGLGLLFLIAGKVGSDHKIVLSRFPTDSAIHVDEGQNTLSVQFLERVFMKSKTSYKAVLYKHGSLAKGFWSGRAIDKQLNSLSGEPSNYWIQDFLASDFTTTAAMGTRRLALAIRDAAKHAPLSVKQELTAAGTLANGLHGKKLSILDFGNRMGLSDEAKAALATQLKSSATLKEIFKFDVGIYKNFVAYKSIELSNGALLTADTEKFDKVFQQEVVDGSQEEVKFVTKGKIVDEKFKAAR